MTTNMRKCPRGAANLENEGWPGKRSCHHPSTSSVNHFNTFKKHSSQSNYSTQQARVELRSRGELELTSLCLSPSFLPSFFSLLSFQEIVGFLERQYDDILAEESRIKRNPRFRDNRVHALLYFITPTGHSLREMDIELMRRLSPRVNVIPVLGKSDTMTFGERQAFKKRVSSR